MALKDFISSLNDEQEKKRAAAEEKKRLQEEKKDAFNTEYTKLVDDVIKPFIQEKIAEMNELKLKATNTHLIKQTHRSNPTPVVVFSISGLNGWKFQFDFVGESHSNQLCIECCAVPVGTVNPGFSQQNMESVRLNVDSITKPSMETAIENYIKSIIKPNK